MRYLLGLCRNLWKQPLTYLAHLRTAIQQEQEVKDINDIAYKRAVEEKKH